MFIVKIENDGILFEAWVGMGFYQISEYDL